MYNPYEDLIALSRYARFLPELGRRETWAETCRRYIHFMGDKYLTKEEITELYTAIYTKKVMPSMRCLMTAGAALERENIAGYNCAYIAIDSPRVFAEILYILMCGTGVGFSVERQFVNKMAPLPREFSHNGRVKVEDSKMGWAKALEEFVLQAYRGNLPEIDTSLLRPAGARLKTFGGYASGPEPLKSLFAFITYTFLNAKGRRLQSIECHDIACKIGESVVVGGVRRSALISLSNLSDLRMRDAKSGDWFNHAMHRSLSNNSVAYTETPDVGSFMDEWKSLYISKSGERGIFNRVSAKAQATRYRRRSAIYEYGCNPCSEIILRSGQFCNLTEVIVRDNDTEESLLKKVEWATILGTLQATLTDFSFLRHMWYRNTREEALLGVSLTGIFDNPLLYKRDGDRLQRLLRALRLKARRTNHKWADRLGINKSAAITCVKPSGTVSQLCSTASGIHPRYADYYIRRVRMNEIDPLCRFMIEKGLPHERDIRQPRSMVFSFPQASPPGALTGDKLSAIEHLELWKLYQDSYCEHKPSATITIRPHEWMQVGAWVYDHFEEVSGLSFLPSSDFIYQQAPYEAIDKQAFTRMYSGMPTISWQEFKETEDNTIGSQEYACTGTSCEVEEL